MAAHLDTDELTPGTVLGPYDLVQSVGLGGMARVWAARIRASRQLVALKMLLPQLSENVEFQKMFFDEGRIALRVRHPNVCSTHDLVNLSGILTLVMEWIDGPSLMRVLKAGNEQDGAPRHAIDPRVAARIVADACAGLHAAHDLLGDDGRPLGVVHRDVSPQNLLLTSHGVVKVTDFGVAKAVGKSHTTITGQVKGKLAYMSPEQLIGGGVDRRSDVFSLGCVLYEITTTQKPFQGEHDPQVMAAIMMGNYAPPSAVAPGYPPGLEAIVVRALASEPLERFQTADHMRVALEEFLAATGPAITAAHVAALVEERCGADLVDRRRRDLLCPAPPSAGGKGALRVRTPGAAIAPARAPAGRASVVVAAMIGAMLGLVVLTYIRAARHEAKVARASEAARTAAATVASAPAILELPDTPPAAASSVAPASVAARRPVRLHVTPADATLVVDGVALPKGTDTVDRPDDGGTVTVAVRADRHEETLVLVDAASPAEIEVKLVPVWKRPREAGAARPRPSASASGDATQPLETPPNPYE